MTEQWAGSTPPTTSEDDTSPSTASAAKDEASSVARSAQQSGQQVASSAADQGRRVATEAADQARGLLDEARQQVGEQAGTQQQRAVETLRSIGGDLSSMAENGEDGLATKVVQETSDRVQQAAGWLEGRDPQTVLSDVRAYARRSPGTFLLAAAAAGLIAGRLTRAGVDERRDTGSDETPEPAAAAAVPQHVATPPATGTTGQQYDPVATIDPPDRFGGYATDPVAPVPSTGTTPPAGGQEQHR